MNGTATAGANDGSVALYFALSLGAALLLVGFAWLVAAFGAWRLKQAPPSDRVRLARLAVAAVVAEMIAGTQTINLMFMGLRKNDYEQLGRFFDKLIPPATGGVITVLLWLMVLVTVAKMRGEMGEVIKGLAKAADAHASRQK